MLVEHYPEADTMLPVAPTEIRLRFNEPVTPIAARVLDAAGRAITGPAAVSETDTTLHIALPEKLAAGSYVVSYRVISADSHPVGGSFVFSVGVATDADLAHRVATTMNATPWSGPLTALRALFYAAFLVGAGGALFLVIIERRGMLPRADRDVILVASGIAIISLLAGLGVEGVAAADASVLALLNPATWWVAITSTAGASTAISSVGLVMLVVALLWRDGVRPLVVAGVLLGATGFAATGHVATATPRWLTAPILVFHVLCAAFWVGALLPLARRLRWLPAGTVAPILTRFSGWAVGAVAILLISGLVIAAVQLQTPTALAETDYGRYLALKLALVIGLLLLAAANRLWLTPRLAHGAWWFSLHLHGTIVAELALAGGVIVVTATLGQVPPPRALAAVTQEPAFSVATMAGDRTAIVEMTPARLGKNRIAVTFLDADGAIMAPRRVTLWLSMPSLGVEAAQHATTRDARGRYTASARLPVGGAWRVEIDALVSDFEEAVFATEVSNR